MVFSAQPFTTDVINCARDIFRYEIIWQKSNSTGFLDANRKPLKVHENILLFYDKQCTYNPQKTPPTGHRRIVRQGRVCAQYNKANMNTTVTNNSLFPIDVIYADNTTFKTKVTHSTQKPTPLIEYLIKTYSNPGDTILDPFMGSGTTAVACIQTGRHYIGFETDPTYYANSLKRIAETTRRVQGQQTLF